VQVFKGFHRGQPVSGIFKLIKPFQDNGSGGFITVEDPSGLISWAQTNAPRIKLGKDDFNLLGADGAELAAHVVVEGSAAGVQATANYEQAFIATETPEEAMDRIEETFLMLDQITDACTRGEIRGLVVTGPPGIGKSFGVEKQLTAANMFRTMAGKDPKYEIISGGISAIGLYQKLYYNRSASQVLVFDDCDGVLFDEEALNLLKAALNSGDKRRICWNKESRVLAVEDIPEHFDFEASIIFLSNIDFEKTIAKGSRIAKHLDAIMSRCHYLDLEIGTLRDKLLRIKQIVRDGMLGPYDFTSDQEQEIVDFVFQNAEFLREVSLRMVKKVADFVKTNPTGWHSMAEATCLQREAKFKRLMVKREAEAAKRGVALQLAA
jgi:hypothetical protein